MLVYKSTAYAMIALQAMLMYPPNEVFSEVFPASDDMPLLLGNNRIRLDVIVLTIAIVRVEKRSGLDVQYTRGSMGYSPRGART
jgi:hypothetical protein